MGEGAAAARPASTWWAGSVADIAVGITSKLTALFLLLGATKAGETDLQWRLVPGAVFFGGALYAGRGIRKLRRGAPPAG